MSPCANCGREKLTRSTSTAPETPGLFPGRVGPRPRCRQFLIRESDYGNLPQAVRRPTMRAGPVDDLRGAMKVRRDRLAVLLIVVLATLIAVNGLALWGDTFAMWIDNAMQLGAGLTAAVCGWVVGRRMRGAQRWWRLLIGLGMLGWSCGQFVWSWYQLVDGEGLPSPSLADVGYLTFPGFALAGLFVLARAREQTGGERWLPTQWNAHFGAALVLDGLVVTGSLFILTWAAALAAAGAGDRARRADLGGGHRLSAVGPRPRRGGGAAGGVRPGGPAVPGQPAAARRPGSWRWPCSDSVFAYLVSIGAESMKPWSDAGFVLGPVFIAYALLAARSRRPGESQTVAVDWWRMVLPYVPVLAVALLISCQLLFGDGPDSVEVFVGVIVIFLVLARQLLSLLDNRLLLRRVYEGQQQLAHQAFHDPLTGLANRTLFAERLDRAIAEGAGSGGVARPDLRRPGRLQGGQRPVRPRGRGRRAARGRPAAAGLRAVAPTPWPGSAATSSRSCWRARSTSRRPSRTGSAARCGGRSPCTARRSPSAPAWGWWCWTPTSRWSTSDILLGRADTSMYAGKRLGKDTTVVYRHVDRTAPPDFTAALRRAQGGVPDGYTMEFQPIVRLGERRAGRGRGAVPVDRAGRHPDPAAHVRQRGRGCGARCRDGRAGAGRGLPRDHRRRAGPGRARQRLRQPAGHGGAGAEHHRGAGPVPAARRAARHRDHRDGAGARPRRRGRGDPAAAGTRRPGGARRLRRRVQLADLPARVAGRPDQAGPGADHGPASGPGRGAVPVAGRPRCRARLRGRRRGDRDGRAGRAARPGGLHLAQGYRFGRPGPLSALRLAVPQPAGARSARRAGSGRRSWPSSPPRCG